MERLPIPDAGVGNRRPNALTQEHIRLISYLTYDNIAKFKQHTI